MGITLAKQVPNKRLELIGGHVLDMFNFHSRQDDGGSCSVDMVTWPTIEVNTYFPTYISER